MTNIEASAAGDAIPVECTVIEVHVGALRQLFNAIDPSPFRDRDLDPRVEQFIVDWSREAPPGSPLALLVRLDRPANPADDAALVRDAIHAFFASRAAASRGRLRRLFRVGRVSLTIGLAVLTIFLVAAQFISAACRAERFERGPAREPVDRWLGSDVAPARDLSLRLVAHPRRREAVRQAGRNAGSLELYDQGHITRYPPGDESAHHLHAAERRP